MSSKMRGKRGLVVLAATVAAYVAGTVVAQRLGYAFGRNVAVKCRAGHVFSTVWIPGASVKALKLGPWRLQWCPVGKHVSLVHPLRDADLTPAEREFAAAHHDVPIP